MEGSRKRQACREGGCLSWRAPYVLGTLRIRGVQTSN